MTTEDANHLDQLPARSLSDIWETEPAQCDCGNPLLFGEHVMCIECQAYCDLEELLEEERQ